VLYSVGRRNATLLLVLVSLAAIPFGAGVFLPPSMQAEVIDYDELYTGRRREAQYAGFWSILAKLAAIPSAALPIALLASLGYVPNAVQSPQVISAIRILTNLGPAIAAAISFAIVYRFPINAQNHVAILEGILRHRRGENAIDPLTGREVAPPGIGFVDEASGWFLDNFSTHELQRFLDRGSPRPLWDVGRAAALSLAVFAMLVLLTLRQMAASRPDSG